MAFMLLGNQRCIGISVSLAETHILWIPTLAEVTAAMASSVSTVSLSLLPYWPRDFVVCFAQVETQLVTCDITSYQTCMAHAQQVASPLVVPCSYLDVTPFDADCYTWKQFVPLF